MPFPYYRRLTRRQQAIYRKSDRIAEVPLPDRKAIAPLVSGVHEALLADDRADTEAACQALVREMVRMLGTEPVSVRVLSVRPSNAEAELHGLYVREQGKRPVVHVWMRTAAHQRVVAFRTFLRTLFHELCHHLDYSLFGLEDSFHTEGFFRRESSLMRQLAPRSRKPPPKEPPQPDEGRIPASQRQLSLPI